MIRFRGWIEVDFEFLEVWFLMMKAIWYFVKGFQQFTRTIYDFKNQQLFAEIMKDNLRKAIVKWKIQLQLFLKIRVEIFRAKFNNSLRTLFTEGMEIYKIFIKRTITWRIILYSIQSFFFVYVLLCPLSNWYGIRIFHIFHLRNK